MLCKIPSSDSWSAHLRRRQVEAVEVRLLESEAILSWSNARVFVPSQIDCAVLNDSRPEQPLRSLYPETRAKAVGWVRRNDLYWETADWLCKTYAAGEACLFCEAGYSKLGDKSLQQLPFIAYDGRPILRIQLTGRLVDEVATVLRRGRSWRFLGIVLSEAIAPLSLIPATQGLFVCDAFDGDSLIVVDIST